MPFPGSLLLPPSPNFTFTARNTCHRRYVSDHQVMTALPGQTQSHTGTAHHAGHDHDLPARPLTTFSRSVVWRIRPFLLLFCLALAGCQFTPSPTSRTVTTNDVVGVWSFTEDEYKTTVLMTFMPSGIFTQQVIHATRTNVQVGRWTLDGPHLQLADFRAHIGGKWVLESMDWYFIDGDRRKLEIFGGAFPDPDAFQHLIYLRPPP
ncbi:MAG: hypothetical protein SFY81_10720 [Verrucomicrobiota bacterium]|nr:hypothetical protein [Verrucomicrobiota bacterium]